VDQPSNRFRQEDPFEKGAKAEATREKVTEEARRHSEGSQVTLEQSFAQTTHEGKSLCDQKRVRDCRM